MNPVPPEKGRKEDEEGGGEGSKKPTMEANNIGRQSNLELRLGISLGKNVILEKNTSGGETGEALIHGLSPGFSVSKVNLCAEMSNNLLEPWLLNHSPCGFIDPWSLAARQQKAVLEQAHRQTSKPSSSSPSRALPSNTRLTTPPVVGWPPVCAFRKNMAMTSHATRPDVDGEREAKRAKLADGKVTVDVVDGMKGAMFVKVNMEGYAVGRKVDLKAHDSYDSLSCSLKKMFNNFLSIDYSSEEELRGKTSCVDFLLLYEDHEGDRMLVGDVPWDMFLSSVKRLYIVRSPKGRDRAANMDAGE